VDYKHRLYPNRLKVIRQNAGYDQTYVSKLLGHSNGNALCLWEQERAMPNGTNLIKLCIIYRKTPRELFPEYYHRLEQQVPEL
jgi:DNA-binding transcriptional regulator YiaG